MRSRIVLAAAEGLKNVEIAERLAVRHSTVRRWRNRFAAERLGGLLDEPRVGRPRAIDDAKVEEVIVKTLERTPRNATHWSTRSLAAEVGLSQSAVSRIWRAFALQPHRQETWKLSRDPQFRGEGTRHRRPVPEPARASCRPVRGRGDPNAVGNFEFEWVASRPVGRSLP
jgi:transposase